MNYAFDVVSEKSSLYPSQLDLLWGTTNSFILSQRKVGSRQSVPGDGFSTSIFIELTRESMGILNIIWAKSSSSVNMKAETHVDCQGAY